MTTLSRQQLIVDALKSETFSPLTQIFHIRFYCISSLQHFRFNFSRLHNTLAGILNLLIHFPCYLIFFDNDALSLSYYYVKVKARLKLEELEVCIKNTLEVKEWCYWCPFKDDTLPCKCQALAWENVPKAWIQGFQALKNFFGCILFLLLYIS